MDVLVAGASGAVGGELCRRLERSGATTWRISRSGGPGARDVAWRIGAEEAPRTVRRSWDVMVNAAADTRWGLPAEEAYTANTASTAAFFALAGPDTHVVQLSTIAVEGRGAALEHGQQNPEDFHNTYEWAKARAEVWVAREHPGADIVRLPLICGRRDDGFIDRFGGVFALMRGLCSGALPVVVGDPGGYVDIASTDDAAGIITRIVMSGPAGRTSGHARVAVVGGGTAALSVDGTHKVIIDGLNEWRARRGVAPIEPPPYVKPRAWDRFYLPMARKHLSRSQLGAVESYGRFRPYFNRSHPIDVTDPVADPSEALYRSVLHWADRHVHAAARVPKPWTSKSAGTSADTDSSKDA
ncbi:SDR family oxidoreductase [Streptomyces sp. MP131-18]|uniref:SDR family oxidoreductase n=1 Tax=Streptomyces sp. MP131-18 TaxID=1857892 RepID=UPI00097CBCEB|nr:SDR family oxidoreductase [Streptomyces sp. MP131-18]